MSIKSLITLPLLLLSFGLTYSFFASPALASCDSSGNCFWEEYRVHCKWKNGRFGLKYRSCASQYRVCRKLANIPLQPATPQKCDDWQNRF
jgi:hypothetical protein